MRTLLFGFLVSAGLALAQVTPDATASSASQSGSNVATWSHVIGAGTNRVLYVGFAYYSGVSATVSTVTCGTLSLAPLESAADGSRVEQLWWGIAPPVGTCTITVTFSASLNGAYDSMGGGSISFTGASQAAPTHASGGPTGGTAQHPQFSLTVGSANSYLVGFLLWTGTDFFQEELSGVQMFNTQLTGSGTDSHATYRGPLASGAQLLQWYTYGGYTPVITAASVEPPAVGSVKHKVTEGR